MTDYLIVKVINTESQKVIYERVLTCPIVEVRFSTLIDAFSILYSKLPHKVVFDYSQIDKI